MENVHGIVVVGVVTVPTSVDQETFESEFLHWIESKGYAYGGTFGTVHDEEDKEFPLVMGFFDPERMGIDPALAGMTVNDDQSKDQPVS